jgi:hypothetical protein
MSTTPIEAVDESKRAVAKVAELENLKAQLSRIYTTHSVTVATPSTSESLNSLPIKFSSSHPRYVSSRRKMQNYPRNQHFITVAIKPSTETLLWEQLPFERSVVMQLRDMQRKDPKISISTLINTYMQGAKHRPFDDAKRKKIVQETEAFIILLGTSQLQVSGKAQEVLQYILKICVARIQLYIL